MSGLLGDDEYDRRLLARMQRDVGRTTNPTVAEQRAAIGGALRQGADLAADLLIPQSPADFALMAAFGPGGRLARLPVAAGLLALEPDEAEASRLTRAARAARRGVAAASEGVSEAPSAVRSTRRRGTLGIEPAPETRLYPIADTPPSFKVEPAVGQPFESWLDALYSPAVRGPDNRIRHPSLMYRGVSDAELQAAVENRAFRPASGDALYIENDPTRYTGGGAYGARGGGAIVQFDAGGLPSVQLSSQRVRDLVEDAVPEIPLDRVTRMWRWNPDRSGHTLLTPDEMARLLRLSAMGGVGGLLGSGAPEGNQ